MEDDQKRNAESAAASLSEMFPLAPVPRTPPFELLEKLRKAISDLDPLGPKYDRIDLLQRVEKEIFDGDRIKSFAGNKAISWVSGVPELRKEILACLKCEGFSAGSMLEHLLLGKKGKLRNAQKLHFGTEKTKDEILKEGLVFIKAHYRIRYIAGRGTTFNYAVCGTDWASFFWELGDLTSLISNLWSVCAREARVLAIEETASGRRFLQPGDKLRIARKNGNGPSYRFFLTRDLPDSWFYGSLGPRGREERMKKKEALRWLNGHYLSAESSGLNATKSDAQNALRNHFDISSQAMLDEIWREAAIDSWRKPGVPRRDRRYSFDNKYKIIE